MRVGPTQKEEETLELTLSFQALRRGHMKTRQNAVVYKPERERETEIDREREIDFLKKILPAIFLTSKTRTNR